jgi:hypothetical protein
VFGRPPSWLQRGRGDRDKSSSRDIEIVIIPLSWFLKWLWSAIETTVSEARTACYEDSGILAVGE